MAGFKKFLLRGNVVDLAVAVIIGAAFSGLVQAFTSDLLTPIIAAIGGKPDFAGLHFTIHHSIFLYGHFLNAVISFVILAAVVYFFVVLPINSLLDRFKPAPDEPTPVHDCPHCLSSIPQAATACAFCTRDVTPAAA
ncbi:MAG: large conductance mechanosensitive channel protein MscL [Frankiaceae bacterium]|nr:large conductance mechanosensitive channel protein MscL [Frankiaceae bacterium]MBV9869724.1 large conductance mechanosensitive channel protein MscL [Frankiaceae bacterium]